VPPSVSLRRGTDFAFHVSTIVGCTEEVIFCWCAEPEMRCINRKLSLRAERSNLAKQEAEFATDCFVGLRPSRNDVVGELGCELPVRDTSLGPEGNR
jgi:hypothetical protein